MIQAKTDNQKKKTPDASQRLREKKRLNALFEISEKIISSLDLKIVLNRIMNLAMETLDANTGSLMLLSEKNGRLQIKASVGLKPEVTKSTSIKVGERIAGWVAQHHKPLLLLDGLKQHPDFSHLGGKKHIKSALSVPLKINKKLIGVLNINQSYDSIHPAYTDDDLELLTTLANQATIAIHNARLHFQIKEQNLKLKRNSQLKTEFISNISHELRSPLSAIRGHTANILDGLMGGLTREQQTSLQKIEHLCHRQNNLENQLLDISRIASGGIKTKRTSLILGTIINNALPVAKPLADKKKIIIDFNLPKKIPPIWGNQEQLERVFINLLDNAVKYTPESGNINIRVRRQKNYLLNLVTDTGIGIPKTSLKKIFNEFYRVDTDLNCQVSGTGLGLALVKHIIEAHHGKIWVKSRESKGTTFFFTLPLDPRIISDKKTSTTNLPRSPRLCESEADR